MNETTNNTTPTNDDNKAQKRAEKEARKKAREAAAVIYPTADEAIAGKPQGGPKASLFHVTDPAGKSHFTWAFMPDIALARVARSAGWSAAEHGKAPNPEKLAATLRLLSPQERAALLAEFASEGQPVKTGRKGK
jgi:hypothetical protein